MTLMTMYSLSLDQAIFRDPHFWISTGSFESCQSRTSYLIQDSMWWILSIANKLLPILLTVPSVLPGNWKHYPAFRVKPSQVCLSLVLGWHNPLHWNSSPSPSRLLVRSTVLTSMQVERSSGLSFCEIQDFAGIQGMPVNFRRILIPIVFLVCFQDAVLDER